MNCRGTEDKPPLAVYGPSGERRVKLKVLSIATFSDRKKWKVEGKGESWVFDKTFPTKWKAELALKVFQKGGRFSDYGKAARTEAIKREDLRSESVEFAQAEAREKFRDVALPESEQVWVCRHPGSYCSIPVALSKLSDFRLNTVSGGVGKTSPYPMLYAKMWCSEIPEEDRPHFGHTCEHGPPPHHILVCITKTGNPTRTYQILLAKAH